MTQDDHDRGARDHAKRRLEPVRVVVIKKPTNWTFYFCGSPLAGMGSGLPSYFQ
jgi:hypothetical protein